MQLPDSKKIPVNLLASCFNNTSATYKFYWLLSILQEIEEGNLQILKLDLFARMISNAWYTVNYFHVSFGKQDLIQSAVRLIKDIENISIDKKQETVFEILRTTNKKEILRQLQHFNKNVPHWFLSPWFPRKSKSDIYRFSRIFEKNCIYALQDDFIEINPEWMNYLKSNARILKDFCYWNLSIFLQTKNPNVPDIPNKLIKPASRNSLIKQRKQFWDIVLRELGSVNCIYTNKKLTVGNYAVEHFIPYSFVSHDLIWNLIPADPSFNSTKSNKLPVLDQYFSSFFKLQKTAVEIIHFKAPKNRLLEDYLTIFPDLEEMNLTEIKFRERIQPIVTIAANNGFEFLQ